MITPMSNCNFNSINSVNRNNSSLSINSLKNIESQNPIDETNSKLKNNPAFKGTFGREATLVFQNLSKDAQTRLGTSVSFEYMKDHGFVGKMFNFMFKILDSIASKNAAAEFVGQGKKDIQYQRAELTVGKLIQEYLSKAMPDGKGGITFDASNGGIINNCLVGKGFKIYSNGNVELEQNIRKSIIDILENCKSYKEIKEKFSEVKSIL